MSYEVWCHTLVAQVSIEVVDLAPPLVSRPSHPMDEENQRLLNFRESPRGSLLGTALKLLPEKVEYYTNCYFFTRGISSELSQEKLYHYRPE